MVCTHLALRAAGACLVVWAGFRYTGDGVGQDKQQGPVPMVGTGWQLQGLAVSMFNCGCSGSSTAVEASVGSQAGRVLVHSWRG